MSTPRNCTGASAFRPETLCRVTRSMGNNFGPLGGPSHSAPAITASVRRTTNNPAMSECDWFSITLTSLDRRGCCGPERAQRTPASPAQKIVLDERVGNLDDLTYRGRDDHALIGENSNAIAECNQGIEVVGDHDHAQLQLLMQLT